MDMHGFTLVFVSFVWVVSNATKAMVSMFPLLCRNVQEVGCPAAWFLGEPPSHS